THSEKLVMDVNDQLVKQLAYLERAETAKKALEQSKAIVIPVEIWAETINQYAPEHLILMGKYENEVVEKVVNAGSVFLGKYTAESFGDYASGTNHTLPTNGFARSYSGVSLDSFVKKITFQRIEEIGLRDLGPTVVTLANAEELTAHANAISVRLNSLSNDTISSLAKTNTNRIEALIRKDLKNVIPYSSARDEFTGNGEVFLDANENGLLTELNRYPDPFQRKLKAVIAEKKQLKVENLVLGNGSDEIIDLVFRLFGTPLQDSVAYLNPSYGMYSVLAKLNGLSSIEINLRKDFSIDTEAILQQARSSKLLVLCNPNNPTGNLMDKTSIETIIKEFEGIVVVDEAYIDFCKEESVVDLVDLYPNLIVLQTLSKAYGMAGLRIGMAISNTKIVQKLNGIKAPYNISSAVQELAIDTLNSNNWDEIKAEIISERNRIRLCLNENKSVVKVFPSEANFILFRINQADEVYQKLVSKGVVVRNRSTQYNCENTLRVSIGSPEENNLFIKTLSEIN
ncbi:MAG: histidinol-phosphate transaminase, partial [Fluviicola sp.]